MANVDARIKTYPATLGLSASGNDIYGEASTGDVDAFDEKIPPLNWDLSRGKYAPFPMLWQHDTKAVCGSWPVVQARPHALYVEGRLAEGFPLASMARKLIQQGHISSLSVGFKEVTSGYTDAEGIRVLGRCLLYEVSLTPMAANI